MVSATRPGPNDMAQPLVPGAASRMIRSSTNITVPDDMLPKSFSTDRERRQRRRRQGKGLLHRIQHRAPARMHRPQIDIVGAAQYVVARRRQGGADGAGHPAGQHHVETLFADIPADQFGGVGHQRRLERIHPHAHRIGGNERRGAAIGEQQEGENFFQIVGLVQMQGAQFQIHRQHPRAGLGAHDMARQLQAR